MCQQANNLCASYRLLVVVCDLKVLLYEVGSKHVREVSKVALEGKSASCCAFLLLGGKVGGQTGKVSV